MQRREFLAGATAAGVSSITGCIGSLGESDPDLEFQHFIVPDPTVASVDSTDDEYSATIQNRGEGGNVRVELWYYRDSEVPNPSAPSIYQEDDHEGRHFDLARSRYFNGDERRDVSITGDGQQFSRAESPEFSMNPWPAAHGASFENTGGSGEVEFRFEYRDTGGYTAEEPSNQIETMGSDETLEIMFSTVIPPGAEYEILADQA